MNKFAALIFDCDGVLINSEEIAVETEIRLLESVGVTYRRDEYVRKYCGTSDSTFAEGLQQDALEQTGQPLPDSFFDAMSAATREGFEAGLAQIPGADQVAREWTGPKAVASSSSTDRLAFKLQRVGLAHLFGDHIYSADLVTHAKPQPDIFLYAAEALDIAPHACLVVEDSANGVLAAKRAGMTALGFTAGKHCLPDQEADLIAAGADYCFSDFSDLGRFLDDIV